MRAWINRWWILLLVMAVMLAVISACYAVGAMELRTINRDKAVGFAEHRLELLQVEKSCR